MFTLANTNTIAKAVASAVEGEGAGHTVYVKGLMPRRYVVGGYKPSLLFPVGAAVGHVRERVRAWVGDSAREAETLGMWEHDGTVHVDLGNTFASLTVAMHAARRRGELAVYDRETGECLMVNWD